jgi:hypothetical protein
MALLLFLQWIGCPAHCLVDATAGYEHIGCFTTAPADPGHPDPLALTLDHVCPACTALGQAVLPEPPAAPMRRVVWSVAVRFVPAPMVTEAAPRAPPVQPRAPPAFV